MKLDVRKIIEASRKRGPTRPISFTLPIEAYRDLQIICKKENVVMTSLIAQLIKEFICNEQDETAQESTPGKEKDKEETPATV